jgi:hypothetical protein
MRNEQFKFTWKSDAFTFVTQMKANETEILNNKYMVYETVISLGPYIYISMVPCCLYHIQKALMVHMCCIYTVI